MADIRVDHVTKMFGSFAAVNDLDVSFANGEVTCLLGPSGCGKTTLMRIVAGLETPTRGCILFGGRDVTGLRPRDRNIGMVFQYPVMYPTLSVAENIELPLLQDRSIGAAERAARVDEVLDVLDLRGLRNAFIGGLDSGNRQKVAVGRAVARQSDIVLFDEPTTNVEVNAKLALIRAFKTVAQRLRQTIIYVTHDQTEAMTLADRIALMLDGRIVQYDKPHRLYDYPETEFGGWFLGNPGMNFIAGEVAGGTVRAAAAGLSRPLPAGLGAVEKIVFGVRPERIRVRHAAAPGTVVGRLLDRSIGIAGRYLLRVAAGDTILKIKTDGRYPGLPGDVVHIEIPADAVTLFADGRRVAEG